MSTAKKLMEILAEIAEKPDQAGVLANRAVLDFAKAKTKRKQRYAINKTKYLLQSEQKLLRSTLTKFAERDFRNVTMFLLLLETGARAQELLNLTKEDLNEHDQTVLIHGLKGSSDREIPLNADLFARVWKLSGEGPIFDITYNRLRQIWELYRPCKKKLHSLRHTFAINLYESTKDLRLLQKTLGHRNITNTMVYADYAYGVPELRKLMRRKKRK